MVPHARNADRLDGVTAARLFVRCPAARRQSRTSASRRAPGPPLRTRIAAGTCEAVNRRRTPGRRLPSHDELMTAIGDYGITLADGGELTRNVYPSATDPGGLDVLFVADPGGESPSPKTRLPAPKPSGASPTLCNCDAPMTSQEARQCPR